MTPRWAPQPGDELHEEDWRREVPRLQGASMARNRLLLDQLRSLAEAAGMTLAQMALAWLLSQDNVVPLPGMRRLAHLEENVAALSIDLPGTALRELDLFAPGAVAGERYPEYAAAWLDHGTPRRDGDVAGHRRIR